MTRGKEREKERKDRSRRASESRDEEARKLKFRRRALYITRAFIGTGEWSNMTYNRVILATGDFPLYDPVSESSCLPSPPYLRERIKGISRMRLGVLLAILRLRRIASAPAYDSHCVAAINMLIKRQRARSVNLQYISIQQRILIGREALLRGK